MSRSVFAPIDVYAGYYTPRGGGVMRAVLLGVGSAILAWVCLRMARKNQPARLELLTVGAGLILIALGAAPYLAGGHLFSLHDWMLIFVPHYGDWDSRHSLLLGLGLTLVIASATHVYSHRPTGTKSVGARLSVVLALCTLINVTIGNEYLLDSERQKSSIAELSQLNDLPANSVIGIAPRPDNLFLARGRQIRTSEWTGMLRMAGVDDVTVSNSMRCEFTDNSHLVWIEPTTTYTKASVTREVPVRLVIKDCKSPD